MANLFVGNRGAWDAPDNSTAEPLLASDEGEDYDEEQPEESPAEAVLEKVAESSTRPAATTPPLGPAAARPAPHAAVDESQFAAELQREQGEFVSERHACLSYGPAFMALTHFSHRRRGSLAPR